MEKVNVEFLIKIIEVTKFYAVTKKINSYFIE